MSNLLSNKFINTCFAAALAVTFAFVFVPCTSVYASLLGDIQKGFLPHSFSFEKLKVSAESLPTVHEVKPREPAKPTRSNLVSRMSDFSDSLKNISNPLEKFSSLKNISFEIPGKNLLAQVSSDFSIPPILNIGKEYINNVFSRFRGEEEKPPPESLPSPQKETTAPKPKASLPDFSKLLEKVSFLAGDISFEIPGKNLLAQVSSDFSIPSILDIGKEYINNVFSRFRSEEEKPPLDVGAIRQKNANTRQAPSRGELNINAASQFRSGLTSTENATFNRDINVQGTLNTDEINLGGSRLTAASFLLGVQGGDGITITGSRQQPTISSTLWRQSGSTILPGSARSLYINELSLTDDAPGATSSSALLSIKNASTTQQAFLIEGASGQVANLFSIRNSLNTDLLVVDGTGRIGLNTSPSLDNIFTVGGNSRLNGNLTVSGTSTFNGNFTVNSGVNFATVAGQRVGIGTANPTDTLTVQGTLGLIGNLRIATLLGCSGDLETDASGVILCGTDEKGGSGGGSNTGIVQSGSANRLAYYSGDGRTVEEATNLYYAGGLGVGISTSTAGVIQTTGVINVGGAGISTFTNGINLTTGCFAVNNSCVGGSDNTGADNFSYLMGAVGGPFLTPTSTVVGLLTPFTASSTIQRLTSLISTSTSATSTNFYVSGSFLSNAASSTLLNAFISSTTVTNFYANFGTTTNATSTFLAVTTYASTSALTVSATTTLNRAIVYSESATSTISGSVNSFSIGTTTAVGNSPIFSIDGLNGRVGIGSSTPYASFAIAGLNGQHAFSIGSTSGESLLVDTRGFLGIGTSSPVSRLSIVGTTTIAFATSTGLDPLGLLNIHANSIGTPALIYGRRFTDDWNTTLSTSTATSTFFLRFDDTRNLGLGTGYGTSSLLF